MTTFVVVGAGEAGGTAAATLREEGFDGEIVLIGAEPMAPYERPPLSKEYLRGESGHVFVRPPEWYGERDIRTRFGTRAERVNVADSVVELEGGGRVPYDHVVIATGSRNRRPPIPGLELPGVFDLRFAPNADAIKEAAKNGSKAVLVGMGFIGAEVTASLRQLGLEATVIEATSTPMERVLGPVLGGAIAALHRDHGVEMIFNDGAERFEGDGRFEAMVTREGRRIEGDFAVVGVGVEPVTDVAGDGVPVDNGIPVDATLRTAVGNVWAVGDVARHDHPVFGPIRVEHFDNALKMGERVAKNMLGASVVFDDAHWFWSDQYDAKIEMAGFATRWDDMVVRGSIEDRSFSAFLLKDGQLLSTFSMNRKFDVRRSMRTLRPPKE
jgi:3-phenylpropionate/trans-cinnamate dioxygenase ferredoxin reductase component